MNKIVKTVFAIDDNPYFINTLIKLFERLGCDYKVFNHPGEMLEILADLKKDVSVILLDYQMPEIDGINLAMKIRKNSDFVEGLNNKIKVAKRRCNCFFKVESLFQRLFIDLCDYNAFRSAN